MTDTTYLTIEEAFSILLQKPGDDYTFAKLVKRMIDACEKYNFSIIQTEPIVRKDCIHYECNGCKKQDSMAYSSLLKKGNCRDCKSHSNGGPKKCMITTHADVLERHGQLFAQTSYILIDPPDAIEVSKSFKFKCSTCNYIIGPVGISHIKVCVKKFPEFRGCSNCKAIEASKTYKTFKCEHNTMRKYCEKCECGGSALCEHKNIERSCTQCHPKPDCEHGFKEENCVDCGGKNTCMHRKLKQNCSDCSPQNYCNHGKNGQLMHKSACLKCGGSAHCHHENRKQICHECDGSNLCEHGAQTQKCRTCNYPGWLKSVIANRTRRALESKNLVKRRRTLEYLGCTIEQLLEVFKLYYHVETLDNTYHIDHIKPVSKFIDEQSLDQAFHWTNLQPLLAKANLEKSDKWTPLDEENWIVEIINKRQIFRFEELTVEQVQPVDPPFVVPTQLVSPVTFTTTVENDDTIIHCNVCDQSKTMTTIAFKHKLKTTAPDAMCEYCKNDGAISQWYQKLCKEVLDISGHIVTSADRGKRKFLYTCGNCGTEGVTNSTQNIQNLKSDCINCRSKKDAPLNMDELTELNKTLANFGFKLNEEVVHIRGQCHDVVCPCGAKAKMRLCDIKRLRMCNDCKPDRTYQTKLLTKQAEQTELLTKHAELLTKQTFIVEGGKYVVHCKVCDQKQTMPAGTFLYKLETAPDAMCRYCEEKRKEEQNHQDFCKKVFDISGHIVTSAKDNKFVFTCGNCGAEGGTNSIQNVSKLNSTCIRCYRKDKFDVVAAKRILEPKGFILDESVKRVDKRIPVICPCGSQWAASMNDIKRNRRCNNCRPERTAATIQKSKCKQVEDN